MDLANSTTFIKRPSCMSDKQESILYTKEILSGRIFLGCYKERRYVPELNQYRDVIVISPKETDLHVDLNKVIKKWFDVKEIKWVGITSPGTIGSSDAYCFWVKLTNCAFGHYWFQIKHINLVEEEIILNLKCIRKLHVSEEEFTSLINFTDKKNESLEPESSTELATTSNFLENYPKRNIKKTYTCALQFVQTHATWRNLETVVRVTCAVVIAIVAETFSLVGKLGEFVLKLIKELTSLIVAISPILIHLIDFFSKIVGGFFILLAGLLGSRPSPNFLRSIPYSQINRPPQPFPVDWKERNRLLRKSIHAHR